MDTNRDGLITWNEWRGTEGEYVRLDTNGDGRLNPSEFDANPAATNRFPALDANRDGWLTRDEWKWSDGSFYRMDTNSDNRLSRNEFQAGLANTTNRVQNDGPMVNNGGPGLTAGETTASPCSATARRRPATIAGSARDGRPAAKTTRTATAGIWTDRPSSSAPIQATTRSSAR